MGEPAAREEAHQQAEEAPRLDSFIAERREDILLAWERRAREAVAAAQDLNEPALRNHLPKLLVWISDLIRTAHSGGVATPGALPELHAEFRIQSGYALVEVARELALLRQIILEVWESNGRPAVEVKEALRLNEAIDLLMTRSVQTMAAAEQQDMRQRLEVERQLIGIVAHDLRNPLSVISTDAEALLRQPGDTRVLRAATRMRNAVSRAGRLIQDLLDFTQARLGGGIPVNRVRADLHSIVHEVVQEVRAQTTDREIRHEREGEGTALLDADRVAQVAHNLLGNAIKHGAPDAPIMVCTRGEDLAVVLAVRNRGTPIAPEMLAHLFEPLRRGQDRKHKGGVGLGLYIVASIARAHGGTVHAESTDAEGTVFTVRLPRAPAPDAPPPASRPDAV